MLCVEQQPASVTASTHRVKPYRVARYLRPDQPLDPTTESAPFPTSSSPARQAWVFVVSHPCASLALRGRKTDHYLQRPLRKHDTAETAVRPNDGAALIHSGTGHNCLTEGPLQEFIQQYISAGMHTVQILPWLRYCTNLGDLFSSRISLFQRHQMPNRVLLAVNASTRVAPSVSCKPRQELQHNRRKGVHVLSNGN